MTYAIGQTFMNEHKMVAEITKITETGRIKFDTYANGKKARTGAIWTAKEFAKGFPTFIANA